VAAGAFAGAVAPTIFSTGFSTTCVTTFSTTRGATGAAVGAIAALGAGAHAATASQSRTMSTIGAKHLRGIMVLFSFRGLVGQLGKLLTILDGERYETVPIMPLLYE
jgi:hypothetical protein